MSLIIKKICVTNDKRMTRGYANTKKKFNNNSSNEGDNNDSGMDNNEKNKDID